MGHSGGHAPHTIERPVMGLQSVIDADHRVWGAPNLFVCDAA